jgi:hypothetical protein
MKRDHELVVSRQANFREMGVMWSGVRTLQWKVGVVHDGPITQR